MSLDAKRVEQLFAGALELADPDARAQLLDRECGQDRARALVPKPRPRHWTEVVRNRQFTRLVEEALAGKKASR